MSSLNTQQEQEDEEANMFAMALLMPEEFVRKEVKKLGGNFDIEDHKKLKQLADKFKVSVPIMTLCLGQLSRSKLPRHK